MASNFDAEARYAALNERVSSQGVQITAQGAQLTSFQADVSRGFARIEEKIGGVVQESLSSRKPQYQAMMFALAVILAVGGMAYWPIRENTSDLKVSQFTLNQSLQTLADRTAVTVQTLADRISEKFVPRAESERLSAMSAESRARTEESISSLRGAIIGKDVFSERNRLIDSQMADMGRRVDDLRQSLGSTYGLRDAIVDLKDRIQRVEMMRPPSTRMPTP